MVSPTRIELRDFILDRFSRGELGLLCTDYFPDFYRDYAEANTPLTQLANALIEHCERRDKLDNLRAAVHHLRADAYEKQFGRPRLTEVRIQPRNPRQVFISHAHEDAGFGRRLAQDLRDAGLQVWIAPHSIQPGELWARAIDRGLRESGIFIVVLSPAAAQSSWVEQEMLVAIGFERSKHMQFIPLMAQACDLDLLPALLRAYQFIQIEADYAQGLQQLLARLGLQNQAMLDRQAAEAQRLRQEAEERQRQIAAYIAAQQRAEDERKRREATLAPNPAQVTVSPPLLRGSPKPVRQPVAPQTSGKPTISRRRLVLGLGTLAAGGLSAVVWNANRPSLPTPQPTPTATVESQPTALPAEAASAPTAAQPAAISTNSTAASGNEISLSLPGGVTMAVLRVPAGDFLMGTDKTKDSNAQDDEQPQHMVSLSDFYIGQQEVTVAQFAAFANAKSYKTTAEQEGSAAVWNGTEWKDTPGANWKHPRGPASDVGQKQDHPVTCVSWDDATAFCGWLSQHTGQTVRLPTEAQWEKAARGSDGRIYPWGNEVPDDTRSNFNQNVKDTTPVGRYSPKGDSPLGAADMAGNVWEWCADWYDTNIYNNRGTGQVKDPTGPTTGEYRVVRGGAWVDADFGVRSAYRFWYVPRYRLDYLGFRVVVVSPLS